MNKKSLFTAWGLLFILCAGLGFIQDPQGAGKTALLLCALVFFLPPALLFMKGAREKDLACLRLLRNLSALSLLSTLVLIVLNILSALWPKMAGDILHSVLTIVSSPMICSRNWFVSLFLWACLLMMTLAELKHIKKEAA